MSKFLVQLREELQPQNAGGGFRISLCVCVCVSWVWVCVCMSAANCLYTVCGAQLVASLLKRTNALPLVYRIQYITAHYWFTRQHIYYVDALSLSWWLVLIADRPDRESESESEYWKRERERVVVSGRSRWVMQTLTHCQVQFHSEIVSNVKLILLAGTSQSIMFSSSIHTQLSTYPIAWQFRFKLFIG